MEIHKDHRKAILARLDELGESKYWLAQQLIGKITDQMLYKYLRGSPTTTDKLQAICDVLDLKIAWGDGPSVEESPQDSTKYDLLLAKQKGILNRLEELERKEREAKPPEKPVESPSTPRFIPPRPRSRQ